MCFTGDLFRSGDQSPGRRGFADAGAAESRYADDWAQGGGRNSDTADVGDEDFAGDAFDRSRAKTARPRQLVLGQQSADRASSQRREHGGRVDPVEPTARQTEERGAILAEGHQQQTMTSVPSHIVDAQRWSAPQPAAASARHEPADGQSSPADAADRHDGLRKKKPSALEKVSVNSEADSDKRVSPSRRSPRSPPRSPSWMRYRDGSSRSSPNRTLSPPISPTARYQSSLPDSAHGDCDSAYDGDYFTYGAGGYIHDQEKVNDATVNYNDRTQPKPARSFDAQRSLSDDAIEMESLDLATFAAAVASDTAHLTNMSVSPTQHDALASDTTHDEFASPTSITSGELDSLPEPKPKNIDHHGNKRQKTKPPPTDWSPVTDLSPILDVSPSIEAIEQAEMLAHQDFRMRASDVDTQGNGDTCYLTQSLKRYQHFDDISKIGNGVLHASDEIDSTRDMLGDVTVGDIKSAREISNEQRGAARVQTDVYSQPPANVAAAVTFAQNARRPPDVTSVTTSQATSKPPETTPVTLTQTMHRTYDVAPVYTLTQTTRRAPDVTPVTLTQTTPVTLTQTSHRHPVVTTATLTQPTYRTSDITPVTVTQTTRRTPDVTPVTLTQTTRQTPDVTPVTLTQTTRRTPDITPVTLTQTTRRTPDVTPVTLTQTTRRTPDVTPVTLTQTTRRTPDVTPVTLTQTTRRTPDITPVTLTQTTRRTPDVTPVTLTQTTRRTPDVTPVTLTQTTRRTPDVTPVTLTQTPRRTPDVTPITSTQTVSGRVEDTKADRNKLHQSSDGLNRETRSLTQPDTSALSHQTLQMTSDEQVNNTAGKQHSR